MIIRPVDTASAAQCPPREAVPGGSSRHSSRAPHRYGQNTSFPSSQGLSLMGESTSVAGEGSVTANPRSSTAAAAVSRKAHR